MSGKVHVPVLLGPVLEGLDIHKDGTYVDGTFGRGGHSSAILEQLGPAGRLIAIDRDPAAIKGAPGTLIDDPRFELVRGEYAQLESIVRERNLAGKVDGLLLDIGVSSPQLDEADRGFSFMRDGPLDMRMDPETGESAAELLARIDQMDLRNILRKYGEEAMASRIAREVVSTRENTPIVTTSDLARIVLGAVPARMHGKKHPATKTFQALRIYLNDELGQLERGLEAALNVLGRGGRLCVITFHSLEDRIVKRFMRDHSRESEQYRGMPNVPPEFMPALALIGKPVTASSAEIEENVRARSARLRIAERR